MFRRIPQKLSPIVASFGPTSISIENSFRHLRRICHYFSISHWCCSLHKGKKCPFASSLCCTFSKSVDQFREWNIPVFILRVKWVEREMYFLLLIDSCSEGLISTQKTPLSHLANYSCHNLFGPWDHARLPFAEILIIYPAIYGMTFPEKWHFRSKLDKLMPCNIFSASLMAQNHGRHPTHDYESGSQFNMIRFLRIKCTRVQIRKPDHVFSVNE